VEAASITDAYLAQGYLHARDRFWQMDLNRRVARGELAQLLGSRALSIDRLTRRIGFTAGAERSAGALSREEAAVVDAYARGVNAYLRRHRRPLEHLLLLARPRPWHTLDTLAHARFMSWAQSPGWAAQLVRARLLDRRQASTSLEIDFPAGVPQASNAWAVSARRSATGHALLASDPHIAPQLPAIWHIAHLRAPGLDVTGVGFPGIPGIVIGHNARIAWGVANMPAVTDDLVLERWEKVRVRRETIPVRLHGNVEEPIPYTDEGPLLNGTLGIEVAARPIALKSIGSAAPGPLPAVLALNRAHDWPSFLSALSKLELPCLSFVYADVDGNVGFKLAGRIPLRRVGDGRLPQEGDEGPLWEGTVPFECLPQGFNPASGFVATANNEPVDHGSLPAGADWADDTRWRRICQLLSSKQAFSLDDMSAMQSDLGSVGAQEVLQRLRARGEGIEATDAGRRLLAWDGVMRPDAIEPSIYTAFRIALVRRTHPDLDGRELGYLEGRGPHASLVPTSLFYFRATSNLLWWMDRASDETVRLALDDAVDRLRAAYGPLDRWQWGRLHSIRFPHALGRGSRLLAFLLGLSRGPRPIGGDGDTIAQAGVDPGRPFDAGGFAVSYRQIFEVGDWDRARVVLPGGQSGHPGSRHYDDLLSSWHQGRYVPLLFSEDAIRTAREGGIALVPAAGRPH
jgi:penicillin amidase